MRCFDRGDISPSSSLALCNHNCDLNKLDKFLKKCVACLPESLDWWSEKHDVNVVVILSADHLNVKQSESSVLLPLLV